MNGQWELVKNDLNSQLPGSRRETQLSKKRISASTKIKVKQWGVLWVSQAELLHTHLVQPTLPWHHSSNPGIVSACCVPGTVSGPKFPASRNSDGVLEQREALIVVSNLHQGVATCPSLGAVSGMKGDKLHRWLPTTC